ncbi:MAG: HTTM domain-containing protein [Adhaeribacter sp.]
MVKRFFGKLEALYAHRVDALGLAFFRIAYSLVLLLEVKQLFTFRGLIFSEVSTPISLITTLLLIWAAALVCLFLGYYTRLAALINYIIGVYTVWQMPDFKYHLDFVMTTVNFLLLFLPVSVSLSLDKYLEKKQQPQKPQPTQVSSLYSWLLVTLGIGLVYLDSAVNKLDSPMWLSGLGFWLPSSLPQNALTNLSWVLNQEFFVRIIGYGILAFEIFFIFLISFRTLRWPLIIVGILLHLGIGIAYPIPHFALLMLALYIPLLPDIFWQKLRGVFRLPQLQTKAAVNVSDELKSAGGIRSKSTWLTLFMLYAVMGQIMCMLAAPIVQDFASKNQLKGILKTAQYLFKPFYFVNQKLLGIVSHDIFLDKHFADFDQLINISYLENNGNIRPLPLFTQTGQPGTYSTGRLWTKWAYRVTGANPDKEKLAAGIEQFISFWARQHGINLDSAVFLVQVKKIEKINNWEKDFLNRQLNQPWITVGRVVWQNQQSRIEWFSW